MGLFRPEISIGLTGFCVNEVMHGTKSLLSFLNGTFNFFKASFRFKELN